MRVSDTYNLAICYPELAEEWDLKENGELKPEYIAPHSNKKVGWKCSTCGRKWKATVNNRSKGSRCPYCTGRYLSQGVNDLQSQRPDIAAEWDTEKNGTLTPDNVAVHSNRSVWWICRKGHEWQTQVSHRTGRHSSGCPICKANRLLSGLNDAATRYPELIEQVHPDKNQGKSSRMESCASQTYFVWRCKKGHEWLARVRQRTTGYGCPYCSGMRVVSGENDLQTQYPELAQEWDIEKNGTLVPGCIAKNSDRLIWWKCSRCEYIWKAMVWVRIRGMGCPKCYSTNRVVVGKNDLKSNFPDVAAEWDMERNGVLKPDAVTQYSNQNVWWKCEKGHSWLAVIYSRTLLGSGCPFCQGRENRIKD